MNVDENLLSMIQKHLGYTDAEIKKFAESPKNLDIISKAADLMSKTIVVEVVESHGCNSQHRVGDKIYLDGAGNIITKLSPKRICIFAMQPIGGLIYGIQELSYAGVDPNEMRLKRVSCPDVGVQCGGWGQIVMEIRVEDRKES
jgi:uncharacterized repeat protein (TIGR04076 family)